MSKRVRSLFWLFLSLLAVGFLAWKVFRDELLWTTFRQSILQMHWQWTIPGMALYFIAQPLLATRWLILLRVQQVRITIFQAVKLTWLGLFYNNVMPGAVGGDLLKGWYITHHSPSTHKLQAAVTVFVDRLMGLVGMILVGAVSSMFAQTDLEFNGIQVRKIIWILFAGLSVLAILFLSRHVRQALRISVLMKKLPFAMQLYKVDSAIRLYRSHVGSVVVSLLLTAGIQGIAILAVWMLSQAMGFEKVRFTQCLIIMPIVWLISAAIPVPAGLGITEGSIVGLFRYAINPEDPASAMGQAAALAVMFRLLMIYFASLPGVFVPLFGGHLPQSSQIEHEMQPEEPTLK